MGEVPGVVDVHDLHACTITSGVPVLSAHVVIDADCLAEGRSGRSWTSWQRAWWATSTSSTAPFSSNPSGTENTRRHTSGMQLACLAPFARTWMLKTHRRLPLSGRAGLMVGPLRVLWPWRGEEHAMLAPVPTASRLRVRSSEQDPAGTVRAGGPRRTHAVSRDLRTVPPR